MTHCDSSRRWRLSKRASVSNAPPAGGINPSKKTSSPNRSPNFSPSNERRVRVELVSLDLDVAAATELDPVMRHCERVARDDVERILAPHAVDLNGSTAKMECDVVVENARRERSAPVELNRPRWKVRAQAKVVRVFPDQFLLKIGEVSVAPPHASRIATRQLADHRFMHRNLDLAIHGRIARRSRSAPASDRRRELVVQRPHAWRQRPN